jgi:dethiobiotin synthetase
MDKFFITATGTNIGKTFVTTTLCRQLIEAGKKVVALKPVISGYNPDDLQNDTALILESCDLPITQENIEKISPWRFVAPLSPNMAAEKEEKKIDFDELISFCKNQGKTSADILLIEGVGGVCVPLNDKYTVLDWMVALPDYKIILVAGSYLGSISHTLTAVQALTARNLKLHALIVSESENSSVSLAETVKTLEKFVPESVAVNSITRQHKTNIASLKEVCL